MDKYQSAVQSLKDKTGGDFNYEQLVNELDKAYEEKESFLEKQMKHRYTEDRLIKMIADKSCDEQEEDSRTSHIKKKRKKKGPNSRIFLEYGIAVENFFSLQSRMI